MKKKIKIGNKTLIAEMAYGPGMKDPEAMGHVATVKELADQFEKAIDEKIKTGESEKRSIMTDKSVTSYVTISEKTIGVTAKEKLKDIINELNIRYKAAGWKDITIKKVDGGYSVTLISALTDKDKEDMIKMNNYAKSKSGISESKIIPNWTLHFAGIQGISESEDHNLNISSVPEDGDSSALMPSWIQGVLEEMSASQANNMLGQVASQHLKLYLKENKSAKAEIQKFLTDVVNNAKLQFADEKPTMIWLIKQLGTVNGINIARLEEDKEQITKDIIKFYKYRKELSVKLNDISYSKMKIKLNELVTNEALQIQTLTDFLAKPDIKGNTYSLYIASDLKIASKIAQGTSWCTQNERIAARYIEDYPLYIFYKGNSRFAQMHFTSLQFMDVNDVPLTPEAMSDIRSDIGEQIYNKIKDDTQVKIASYIFKSEISITDLQNIIGTIDDNDIQIISYLDIPEEEKYAYAYEILVKKNTDKENVSFLKEAKEDKIKIIIKNIDFFADKFIGGGRGDTRFFIKQILDGDYFDYSNDMDDDIIDYINDENKKTLFKYLKREGELEEYEEDDIDDIKNREFFRAILNTDIYGTLSDIYNDAENRAYNDECLDAIREAIEDAGFTDNGDGSWYAYIPIDWAIAKSFGITAEPVEYLFEGNYYDEEHAFSLHVPDFDNVYSTINEKEFNNELANALDDDIETDGEYKKRREKEEGQGMLFEEYMKRV